MSTRSVMAMRVWHAVVAAVVVFGFAVQLFLTFTGGADANSGETGEGIPLEVRLARLFSFFTILSNILVLIVSVLIVVRPVRTGVLWRVVHLDALLSIAITGLVFPFVLAPGIELRDGAAVATAAFHYIAPWLFVAGWLVFGPRPQWRWWMLPLAFVWPLAWLLFTFVRGAITGWYPNPFLDAHAIGIGSAVVGALAVLAVAALMAVIAKIVDARLPSLVKPPAAPE